MGHYVVTFSISQIDDVCRNKSKYKDWQIREALNDARIHYENGNVSESWYFNVMCILG